MKMATVGMILVVATCLGVAAAACASGDEEIPRARSVEELATMYPTPVTEDIKALALQPEDLPKGFLLGYDQASEIEGATIYIAHYYDGDASVDDVLQGGASSTDVVVALFDDERLAVDFFEAYASMTRDDMIGSTEERGHWPAEEELQGPEQVEVDAEAVPFGQMGDGTFAWQTYERVRFVEPEAEVAFYDIAVVIRRGRAIGVVSVGATQRAPDMEDVHTLAALLYQRLGRAQE